MPVYQLKRIQNVPISLDEAWNFFSSPKNLATITPANLGFNIISGADEKMYAGQIIVYKVTPLFNIPLTWVTEITQVKEKEFFIDNQVKGPYRLWHHKHFFKPIEGGTELLDVVDYIPPFGIFGSVINKMIIRNELKKIFNFREKKLIELFGQ